MRSQKHHNYQFVTPLSGYIHTLFEELEQHIVNKTIPAPLTTEPPSLSSQHQNVDKATLVKDFELSQGQRLSFMNV